MIAIPVLALPTLPHLIEQAIPELRRALAMQLVGEKAPDDWQFTIEESDESYGAPTWGHQYEGHVSEAVASGIAAGDAAAVTAAAHLLMHAIGSGPMFVLTEEQNLEEAIVEILALRYLAPIGAALRAKLEDNVIFDALEDDDDLELVGPVAASVPVERFGRIAAWLENLDGDAAPEDLDDAAAAWAITLKRAPGGERFRLLARAGAAKVVADDEVEEVADLLEMHLRGYMNQLTPSRTGFAGLEYAVDHFAEIEAKRPVERELRRDPRQQLVDETQAVILTSLPPDMAIDRALERIDATGDTEVIAAVRRTLDARRYLWTARQLDIAFGHAGSDSSSEK